VVALSVFQLDKNGRYSLFNDCWLGLEVSLSFFPTITFRFNSMNQGFCRGAHGVILVYDISNRNSFNHVSEWHQQAGLHTEDCIFVLVGNKMDLEKKREIRQAESEALAREKDMAFLETSAKTSENVEEMFETLARKIIASQPADATNTGDAQLSLRHLMTIEDSQDDSCCG